MVDVVAEDLKVGSLESPSGVIGRGDCGAESVAEVGAVGDSFGNVVDDYWAVGSGERIHGHHLDCVFAETGSAEAVFRNFHTNRFDRPEAYEAGLFTFGNDADWERLHREFPVASCREFHCVQLVCDGDGRVGDCCPIDSWGGDKYFAHVFLPSVGASGPPQFNHGPKPRKSKPAKTGGTKKSLKKFYTPNPSMYVCAHWLVDFVEVSFLCAGRAGLLLAGGPRLYADPRDA